MTYYKVIENEEVVMIGSQNKLPSNGIEISKEEYDNIYSEIISNIEPVEEPNNDYGIPNDVYDSIIDEYTLMLIEEGVIE